MRAELDSSVRLAMIESERARDNEIPSIVLQIFQVDHDGICICQADPTPTSENEGHYIGR